MKCFTSLTLKAVVPASLFLTVTQGADAGVDQGNSVTVLQWIVGVLVFGLYAGNHFKGRIKVFLKRVFFRSDEREQTEDRSG